VTGARRETTQSGGSHLSAGGREGEGTILGKDLDGPWAETLAGLEPFPAALLLSFFCFFCFSFLFLISSISFAFWLQINSNQIQKFSKILSNILG
jgi:hypothetical protein